MQQALLEHEGSLGARPPRRVAWGSDSVSFLDSCCSVLPWPFKKDSSRHLLIHAQGSQGRLDSFCRRLCADQAVFDKAHHGGRGRDTASCLLNVSKPSNYMFRSLVVARYEAEFARACCALREDDHHFESTDAGASHTYPQQARNQPWNPKRFLKRELCAGW